MINRAYINESAKNTFVLTVWARPNEYKYKENRRAFQYVEMTIIGGSAIFKHRGSNIVFRRINEVIEQYLFEETEAAE